MSNHTNFHAEHLSLFCSIESFILMRRESALFINAEKEWRVIELFINVLSYVRMYKRGGINVKTRAFKAHNRRKSTLHTLGALYHTG